MDKVSIIIPARHEPFLQKTVDEVLNNATGEIEVIVMLDAYWPQPPLKKDKRVVIVHNGEARGMRANENAAAKIATGKYLMKLDAHCMVGKGFDTILKADCEKNWVAIPSRYSLDADKWRRFRGPVDYLYLTFPYETDDLYGPGFHGRKWKGPTGFTGSFWHRERERKDIKIDDIMVFQGSCWFMHKEHFLNIEGLREDCLYQEAIELAFKTWLSGGRVIRNKNTWYAHYHKRKGDKTVGYALSKRKKVETACFMMNYWFNNDWPKQTKKIEWYIEKFRPLETWPDDWQDPKYSRGWVHPWLKSKGLIYEYKK